jgi:hypothetical protein
VVPSQNGDCCSHRNGTAACSTRAHASGAADDFHVAAHLQRTVGERSMASGVAHRQHVRLPVGGSPLAAEFLVM